MNSTDHPALFILGFFAVVLTGLLTLVLLWKLARVAIKTLIIATLLLVTLLTLAGLVLALRGFFLGYNLIP
ncbi:MAG: hypothetical protein EXS25_03605 [Pedosphaera sp.]|nr:hypothetical protein [Pedosphaera sp.]